jgi:glycosyltransferase involved in cell wall biosynthesis
LSKKIIHQVSLSQIGGVQRSLSLYFSYALKKSHFNHCIYSMHDLNKNFINVKQHYVNLNSSIIYKIKFIYYLISKNYIVHFYNNLGSNDVNKLLNLIPSSNIIFHERGSAWNAKDDNIKTYKKNSLKADIILANSHASKVMLIKKFGIDKNKIRVIYNGFLSKNSKYESKNINRYSKKISIGYVGRLDTPKGLHILINSAKNLLKYDFFIAGEGILDNQLKKLAKDCKNIHFLGSVKDPLEFILKMDIIVVPSIREPLGNSIIEAGYCKKPVIASNIDGIPEIITNGFNGILIDPDREISINKLPKEAVTIPLSVIDPITQDLKKPKEIDSLKLRNSIVFLASNPNTRELYGENLYKTVKDKFNIEDYYENLEKVYKEF